MNKQRMWYDWKEKRVKPYKRSLDINIKMKDKTGDYYVNDSNIFL